MQAKGMKAQLMTGFQKLCVAIGLLAMVAQHGRAQEIFVWDHDMGKTFRDPETGSYVGCEYGIQQALAAHSFAYTTGTSLPPDISTYDVIFVVLGWC
jgi:hypothetical protein